MRVLLPLPQLAPLDRLAVGRFLFQLLSRFKTTAQSLVAVVAVAAVAVDGRPIATAMTHFIEVCLVLAAVVADPA
jgi:hypothetical protein